jgi:hypothetical protein
LRQQQFEQGRQIDALLNGGCIFIYAQNLFGYGQRIYYRFITFCCQKDFRFIMHAWGSVRLMFPVARDFDRNWPVSLQSADSDYSGALNAY